METANLTIRPNDLLVYFDETGDEALKDPHYPIFGIGGCAVAGDRYIQDIEAPWTAIKTKHFGSADTPLHAANLDMNNTAGIAALGNFFQSGCFARFATVFTDRTIVSPPDTPVYRAMALAIRQQIEHLISGRMFYRFVMVFESSSRGNPFVAEHFSDIFPLLNLPSGTQRAPVERCFMDKSLVHPPLEVADFVV